MASGIGSGLFDETHIFWEDKGSRGMRRKKRRICSPKAEIFM